MSFSSDIKEQLCTVKFKCKNCCFAELSGIFEYSGKYEGRGARFITENAAVAKRVVKTVYSSFGDKTQYRENSRSMQFFLDSEQVIDKIVRWEDEAKPCCKSSYMRGAFLGGGSVTDPQKNYHIEFDTRYEEQAKKLVSLFAENGINARYTLRKDINIVYVKEYEKIAEILSLMGATGGAMELFEVSIERDVRNAVNRQVNCETANADKSARASSKHINAIKRIKAHKKWTSLPESLIEIGEARLRYPDLGLKELGETLDPPLGKSGVNHRLNRLIEIAEGL